jgi:hypothetical protein
MEQDGTGERDKNVGATIIALLVDRPELNGYMIAGLLNTHLDIVITAVFRLYNAGMITQKGEVVGQGDIIKTQEQDSPLMRYSLAPELRTLLKSDQSEKKKRNSPKKRIAAQQVVSKCDP